MKRRAAQPKVPRYPRYMAVRPGSVPPPDSARRDVAVVAAAMVLLGFVYVLATTLPGQP